MKIRDYDNRGDALMLEQENYLLDTVKALRTELAKAKAENARLKTALENELDRNENLLCDARLLDGRIVNFRR